MPDAITPLLGLIQPEVGSSRDTWGAKTNSNWLILDTYVGMATPIGSILDYAGPQAPSGWLICDGRTISRTTYSVLFAVLGTAWGSGDGSTTFNLPNLNGRSGIGPGQVVDQNGSRLSFTFATSLGWLSNPITQSNLPNYTITTTVAGSHNHSGATLNAGGHSHTTDAQGTHSHGGATAAGGNHSHTGYTDAPGDHAHSYAMAQWGSGNWIQGASGTQLNIPGSTTGAAGNHTHNVQTYGSGNLQFGIAADGNHAHNVYAVGDHAHQIYYDGNHQHSFSLGGGGQWFGLLSPVVVVTKIIYAGTQAATALAVLDIPATTSPALEDELAVLREEIASLKALFAPATARVMRSPSRGAH